MQSKRRTALGLALTAMLAFGVLSAASAQASPSWHVNGKAFTGSEIFQSKGGDSFQLTLDFGEFAIPFDCDHEKTAGTIEGGDAGTADIYFSGCTSEGSCHVEEFALYTEMHLVGTEEANYVEFTPGSEGDYWTFGPLPLVGAECDLSGSYHYLTGSFAAETSGTEALQMPLTFSAVAEEALGTEMVFGGMSLVHVDGASTQLLSGGRTGYKWGVQ